MSAKKIKVVDLTKVDASAEEGESSLGLGPKGSSMLKSDAPRTNHVRDDLGYTSEQIDLLFRDSIYPYPSKLSRNAYDTRKRLLQIELLKVQRWAKETGQRIMVVCEGRDAAGKGGTIKRFMEHLNPRGARIVALEKPTEEERGQWYFQRYVKQFPTKGEMVFFDRSWYNRAGVERVMGFCTGKEYKEFLRQTPDVERMLVRSGTILFKYWFSVTRKAQKARMDARESDPLKGWKLSDIDRASRDKWDEYTKAKLNMFFHTDTTEAPWTVVKSDDKKRARLNCINHFLYHLDYPQKDETVVIAPDPLIIGSASQVTDKTEYSW
jgi:polyphosphate kinase 2